MERVLGFGAFSIIRLAYHRLSQIRVAIKSYEKNAINDPFKYKSIKREINLHSTIRHPGVICLYQIIESTTSIHMIMEYMPSISLKEYMKKSKKIGEREGRKISKQLGEALLYCHTNHIIHRDLRLDNILITYKFQVKLIDFGFALIFNPLEPINNFSGTPQYMAPEIINNKDQGVGVDIWALAVLIYKICSGEYPFNPINGTSDSKLFKVINACKPDFPFHFSEELKCLLEKMFKVQAE